MSKSIHNNGDIVEKAKSLWVSDWVREWVCEIYLITEKLIFYKVKNWNTRVQQGFKMIEAKHKKRGFVGFHSWLESLSSKSVENLSWILNSYKDCITIFDEYTVCIVQWWWSYVISTQTRHKHFCYLETLHVNIVIINARSK